MPGSFVSVSRTPGQKLYVFLDTDVLILGAKSKTWRERETVAPPGNSITRPPRSPINRPSTARMCVISSRRKSPLWPDSQRRNARRRNAGRAAASRSVLNVSFFEPFKVDNSRRRSAALSRARLSSRRSSAVRASASTTRGLKLSITGSKRSRVRTRAKLSSVFISSRRYWTPCEAQKASVSRRRAHESIGRASIVRLRSFNGRTGSMPPKPSRRPHP